METTGKILQITRNFFTEKLNIQIEIDTYPVDELNILSTKDAISISLAEFRRKRSLDANAYFHLLNGKIADALGMSKLSCKNMLISKYGQQDFLSDGAEIIYKTNAPPEYIREQEFVHMAPCYVKEENGSSVYFYKVFRGSHTYDRKEMATLINGTIEDAKELGIGTISDAEVERLIGKWRKA